MNKSAYYFLLLIFFVEPASAQNAKISGRITFGSQHQPIPYASIATDHGNIQNSADGNGFFVLENLPFSVYTITATALGYLPKSVVIQINSHQNYTLNMTLDSTTADLAEVEIKDRKQSNGITRLRAVEGVAIYEGKKNEVLVLKEIDANMATNNTREVFAKVPGVNIWESDAAGVQLGIATRGLNPNRTSEFNMRQNGYDMSADALGYPESYYSPPLDMVERVEIVRGAASLQYGPQFGGLINFVMKKGSRTKPLEVLSKNTLGSYGLFASSSSIGGTYKKINYYSFYQYKTGYGWRPNTHFNVHTGYGSLAYEITPRWSISGDITYMGYVMQQPGGLTNPQFAADPSQSFRSRNWFGINWALFSVSMDVRLNETDKINIRNFGTLAQRQSLGLIDPKLIGFPDNDVDRQLISDKYRNFGSEGRYLKFYNIGRKTQTLLTGYRVYSGYTIKQQGIGAKGTKPDFSFQNPDNLETYDDRFPGFNAALFAEHIFNLTDKLSITPGVRYEYISTQSRSYKTGEDKEFTRHFPLLGLGVCYVPYAGIELYANISQNYKSITFTDTKVDIPATQAIDPNLKDVSGYTSDLGIRGTYRDYLNFDISLFYLYYNNRIGTIIRRTSSIDIVNYKTNIGTSRSLGTELFAEINFFKLAKMPPQLGDLTLYVSAALLSAQYIKSDYFGIVGNAVEYAPGTTLRSGVTYKRKSISTTLRYAYTTGQFSEATNARYPDNSTIGIIPEYAVADWSFSYVYKWLIAGGGVNNIFNSYYFTRRALSYPGPGIIPAEPRTFYITLGFKL